MEKVSKEKINKIVALVKSRMALNTKVDPKIEKSIGDAIKKFGPDLVESIKENKDPNTKKSASELIEFANHLWTQVLPVLKSTGASGALGSNPAEIAQSIVGLVAANYSWKAMFGRDLQEANAAKSILKGKTFLNHMTHLVESVFPSLKR